VDKFFVKLQHFKVKFGKCLKLVVFCTLTNFAVINLTYCNRNRKSDRDEHQNRRSDPDRHGVGDNFADLHTTRHFSILAERDRKGESEKKAERKRSPSPKKKAPSKSRSRERPSKGSPARAKKSASRSRYWYFVLYMRQFYYDCSFCIRPPV
jgi:hypothetical protein